MRWIAAATIGLTLFSAVLAHAQPERVATQAGPVTVENVATGLVHPWGMAFLPDGRLLVTERPGRLSFQGSMQTICYYRCGHGKTTTSETPLHFTEM
jgi:glucose/arabinose dehydrogenase